MEQGCDRLTLLDKLLRVKEEMDDISFSEIKGECNTIMMAVSMVRQQITHHTKNLAL